MYTADSIQKVKDIPILDVVRRRITTLKHEGSRWTCNCPFHNEKSGSFKITPSMGIFKCFGCQKGGGNVEFIMEFDGLDFINAVKTIASEFNIDLVEEDDGKTPEQRQQEKDEKTRMYDLMEWACKLYQQELGDEQTDALYARCVTDEDIRKWRIGYAPNSWHTLKNLLVNTGQLPLGIKLGIVIEKEGKNKDDVKHFDFFRHRIMIPICDASDRVIGFGAWNYTKETDQDGKPLAKYMNSRNSDIYDKDKVLFGINHAKKAIIASKVAGIAEGYFDVITAHREGINNVVAPCGTALTKNQVKSLSKYSIEKFHLLPDHDEAGENAAIKAIDIILENGYLPIIGDWGGPEKDVDDLLRPAQNLQTNGG